MNKPWSDSQLFSNTEKGSEKWETPDSLFQFLNEEFTIDYAFDTTFCPSS